MYDSIVFEMKIRYQKGTCTPMCIAALFAVPRYSNDNCVLMIRNLGATGENDIHCRVEGS